MDRELAAILLEPGGQPFKALVGEEARRFFGRTLPGYIDRYHRGRGLHLLHKLMLDTDANGLEMPSTEPTRWAKNKARATLRQMSVKALLHQPRGDTNVLGMFRCTVCPSSPNSTGTRSA